MTKRVSSLLLLGLLAITNAYLLSHPNIVGKLGILLYQHYYIKTFPRALLTVSLVLLGVIIISEAVVRWAQPGKAKMLLGGFMGLSVAFLWYVHHTFSTVTYRMTGKSFIYGAYLLPVIMTGIFGWYLIKLLLGSGQKEC
ncbi:hypothetical protein CLV98_103302 [Dyadobacter jejuensis]|uniref:Uncharacterized protein n=1 Tax=Dyadobacter jejuensis TaxID=1082580 RepID=A0A316AN58_9BACT|nr:hypothetical protein [Dyadobacter jejuensis]PWJ58931.1 hypothetical protein CLV98_103302 [Dyadobacter jejuensis]